MDGNSLPHNPMGRKPIGNLSLGAVNLFIRLKAGMLGRTRQMLLTLFLIIQGTPSSNTGQGGLLFFFLAPKANSAYTISFPAREENG